VAHLVVRPKEVETGYAGIDANLMRMLTREQEGFSPDPYLTGALIAPTIQGIQDAGVMACTKHYIGYEQEHFRQASEAQGYGFNITQSISANIDDKTMHELYLWYVETLLAYAN
jgi:beta-glucosidase